MTELYVVAIISDIHGNAAALDAVLADLRDQPRDATVVAGDLALFGPRPGEALSRVRGLAAPTIHGNTDLRLLPAAPPLPPSLASVAATIDWTRQRIGADNAAWLAGLPFSHRATPPGGASPADDLLVVHATPTDVEAILILEANPEAGFEPTPAPEARALLGDAQANLIVYGHIHYASAGAVGGRRLASVGAVGSPFDGDPRAAYALATWDGRGWSLEHRRVPYDHERVAAEMVDVGMPHGAGFARRLREARPVPLG
jgi:diadenosine tetraphosphatase ApaH/serine/threonine PP2A family protein phosphatase